MKFVTKKWKNRLYEFWIEKKGDALWIHFKGRTYTWFPKRSKNPLLYKERYSQDEKKYKKPKTSGHQELKEKILAPMPGRIQKVSFKQGESVKKGETLFVLSAMKIEYSFQMEANGSIRKVKVKEGDTVKKGELLMELDYTALV